MVGSGTRIDERSSVWRREGRRGAAEQARKRFASAGAAAAAVARRVLGAENG